MWKKLGFPALAAIGGLAVFALVWWIVSLVAGSIMNQGQAGFSIWHTYKIGFSPVSRAGQIWSLIWVIICFAVAVGFARDSDDDGRIQDDMTPGLVVIVVLAILLSGMVVSARTTDNKLDAGPYVSATQFEYAGDNGVPNIISRLVEKKHDIGPPVVKNDSTLDFLKEGFEERPASYTGAKRILSERATGPSGTDVLDETLAYISDREGTGKWTGIRDGKGKRNHIDGIVEWNGDAERVHVCHFDGGNELNYAHTGEWGNSLSDQIREEVDGNYYWSLGDTYGYCDVNDVPVVVIPVKTDRWNGSKSIEVPAGVITVRGSETGSPVIGYKRAVKSGEIPGPVYPISIAAKQRSEANWAAGAKWHNSDSFGFEPVDIDSNAENPSEYTLRSKVDGWMYFSTPLTSKGKSQVIQALSFVRSDTVTYGELNTLRIQVHADNSEEDITLTEQDLKRRAQDVLDKVDSAFLTKGHNGKLEEFLPGEDGTWTVFAVRSGQPRYLLRIRPGQLDQAVEINGGELGRVLVDGSEPSTAPDTDEDFTGLTDTELQARIDDAIDQLGALSAEERSRRAQPASGN